MTNQEIADHLLTKTPTEIADICDDVFEIVLEGTPEIEHDVIQQELMTIGIDVDAICRRKKQPDK